MAPYRGNKVTSGSVEEADIIPFARAAGWWSHHCHQNGSNPSLASRIGSFYKLYSGDLNPLSNLVKMPKGLVTDSLRNGDLVLRNPDQGEASFDVIAMVIASFLEPPSDFPKYVALPWPTVTLLMLSSGKFSPTSVVGLGLPPLTNPSSKLQLKVAKPSTNSWVRTVKISRSPGCFVLEMIFVSDPPPPCSPVWRCFLTLPAWNSPPLKTWSSLRTQYMRFKENSFFQPITKSSS